jgi:hypothetical protein
MMWAPAPDRQSRRSWKRGIPFFMSIFGVNKLLGAIYRSVKAAEASQGVRVRIIVKNEKKTCMKSSAHTAIKRSKSTKPDMQTF